MRDLPYCPLKYIRSINSTFPTANGKFAIEAGPGVRVDHIPNGLKIRLIEVIPDNAVFRIEANNLSTLTPSDFEYVRNATPYNFRGAYLPSGTPYYQWEDSIELLNVADDISDTVLSDNGKIRLLKDGILNVMVSMDADTNGANGIFGWLNWNQVLMTTSSPVQVGTVYRTIAEGSVAVSENDEFWLAFLCNTADMTTQTISNVKIYIDFKPIPEP